MGTQLQHYGNAVWRELHVDETLNLKEGRLLVFLADDPGILSVTLDTATKYQLGADIAIVANAGSENMHVKAPSGTILVTLAPDRAALLSLFDNTTDEGEWGVRAADIAYAGAAP